MVVSALALSGNAQLSEDVIKAYPLNYTILIVMLLSLNLKAIAGDRNDCARSASLAAGNSSAYAVEVCEGSDSDFPALCFRNAVNIKDISPQIAAQLCKYAIDLSPSDCFRTAKIREMSDEDALKLCRHRRSQFNSLR